jgi:acyl-coenzyme A thioesterase PaaI-like protein
MPEISEFTASLADMLKSTVPMTRTLNLEYTEITAERAVVLLPDQPEYRNHVGGPHAGAMFTLAESASGAVVLAAFGDQMGRAVPLPVRAELGWMKLAKGPVTATAELGRPVAEVIAELDAGRRPEFPVEVAVRREDGAETSHLTIVWTLRPNR